MSAVADAIKAAKHEILITDWQIHPHVHLKRSDSGVKSLEWRLDKLLFEKAAEGVKIYILLYWETKLFVDLGGDFAMETFGSNDNITILRHPKLDHVFDIPSLRYSHHEKLVVVDRSVAFVGGIDLCFGRWDLPEHPLTDNYPHHPLAIEKENHHDLPSGKKYSRWVGKDYSNTFYVGERPNYSESLEDVLFNNIPVRQIMPRMPWHDVSCVFEGDSVADIVKHFIQRFNAISGEKLSEEWEYVKDHQSIFPNWSTANAAIQVVRSAAKWSVNQDRKEDSIHQAYLDAIENSQHFIYIENQFFVSLGNGKIKNKIKETLFNRILRAHKEDNSKDFHVMIILPLKTESKEEWCTLVAGSALESITCFTYESLFRGEHSLYGKLEREGVPVDKYLSVYGLRTHGNLDNKLVTEIVYVHSKVMIVDDRLTIIGSANINDRSMLGERDSEVDVVIKDQEMVSGMMNGKQFDVGQFSHSLRCQLMKEHLGLLKSSWQYIDVRDPVATQFLRGISAISLKNTEIYEEVFKRGILPVDYVKDRASFNDWKSKEGLAETSPEEAASKLSEILGHTVNFPKHFMENECNNPKLFQLLNFFAYASYGPSTPVESCYLFNGKCLEDESDGEDIDFSVAETLEEIELGSETLKETGNKQQPFTQTLREDNDYEESTSDSEQQISDGLSLTAPLSMKDLPVVYDLTYDARTQWYNIGLMLGVDVEELDSIKMDLSLHDTKDHYRQMLAHWIRTTESAAPTMSELLATLESSMVGMRHVARRLKQK